MPENQVPPWTIWASSAFSSRCNLIPWAEVVSVSEYTSGLILSGHLGSRKHFNGTLNSGSLLSKVFALLQAGLPWGQLCYCYSAEKRFPLTDATPPPPIYFHPQVPPSFPTCDCFPLSPKWDWVILTWTPTCWPFWVLRTVSWVFCVFLFLSFLLFFFSFFLFG